MMTSVIYLLLGVRLDSLGWTMKTGAEQRAARRSARDAAICRRKPVALTDDAVRPAAESFTDPFPDNRGN
jgi:hypothetical protein